MPVSALPPSVADDCVAGQEFGRRPRRPGRAPRLEMSLRTSTIATIAAPALLQRKGGAIGAVIVGEDARSCRPGSTPNSLA